MKKHFFPYSILKNLPLLMFASAFFEWVKKLAANNLPDIFSLKIKWSKGKNNSWFCLLITYSFIKSFGSDNNYYRYGEG